MRSEADINNDLIKDARYLLFMLEGGGRRKDRIVTGRAFAMALEATISDGLVEDDGEVVSLTERGRAINPASYDPPTVRELGRRKANEGVRRAKEGADRAIKRMREGARNRK